MRFAFNPEPEKRVENANEKVLESLRLLYKAVGTEARPHIAAIANRFKAQGTFRRKDFDRLTALFVRYQIPYQPDNFPLKVLTVELVPKTCWYSNVRSEVDSATWNEMRRQTAKKAENLCEICGGRGPNHPVECHEIWNYDDTQLIQKLDGLIALCPACHEVKHIGLAGANGRADEAAAHLRWVNRWTEAETEIYLDSVWETWEKRSQQRWKLDLSWLEDNFNLRVAAKR